MKAKDNEGLVYLFGSTALPKISPELDLIRAFCIYQQGSISAELDSLKGTGVGKWVLDLTRSSAFSLLAEWGREFHQLKVFCDESKPLQEGINVFKVMVEKEEKIFMEVAGEEHPISFNLVNSPQFVDSKTYPGIQIADILAGTFTFVFRENSKGHHTDYPKGWIPYLESMMSPYSVMPDLEHLDFKKLNIRRNHLILRELVHRSVKGDSLLDGITNFITEATRYLYFNPSM